MNTKCLRQYLKVPQELFVFTPADALVQAIEPRQVFNSSQGLALRALYLYSDY